MTRRRLLMRWHGGKWRLAPWIIRHFPPHRIYTEVYGGAFSVGLRKEPVDREVWNDLDDGLVNLFRVLRDDVAAARLVQQLRLTPFARAEFELSYRSTARDPVERARRMLIRSFMGFGSDATSGIYRTGFRSNSNRSRTTPAMDWAGYPDALEFTIERTRALVLENKPAIKVLLEQDSPDTLHFVDPPYPHETRSRRTNRRGIGVIVYNHEMTTADHVELLRVLCELKGMVVLSSYPNELYDRVLLPLGWILETHAARADGARARVEALYINPAARDRLPSPSLFHGQGTSLEDKHGTEGQAPLQGRDGADPLPKRGGLPRADKAVGVDMAASA